MKRTILFAVLQVAWLGCEPPRNDATSADGGSVAKSASAPVSERQRILNTVDKLDDDNLLTRRDAYDQLARNLKYYDSRRYDGLALQHLNSEIADALDSDIFETRLYAAMLIEIDREHPLAKEVSSILGEALLNWQEHETRHEHYPISHVVTIDALHTKLAKIDANSRIVLDELRHAYLNAYFRVPDFESIDLATFAPRVAEELVRGRERETPWVALYLLGESASALEKLSPIVCALRHAKIFGETRTSREEANLLKHYGITVEYDQVLELPRISVAELNSIRDVVIANIGSPTSSQLQLLLSEKNRRLSTGAAFALIFKYPDEAAPAVPVLVDEIVKHDPLNPKRAIRALGELGAGAEKAIPVISARLNDPNLQIREAALEAVRKIQNELSTE